MMLYGRMVGIVEIFILNEYYKIFQTKKNEYYKILPLKFKSAKVSESVDE